MSGYGKRTLCACFAYNNENEDKDPQGTADGRGYLANNLQRLLQLILHLPNDRVLRPVVHI